MIVGRVLVSVVDDDESVRESIPDLLNQFGLTAHAFSSAEEFLASDDILQTKCLILDITMPGISGLDLHRELKRRRLQIPVVFITGIKDDEIRAQVVEQGAVDCLFKPLTDTALLDALNVALRVQ